MTSEGDQSSNGDFTNSLNEQIEIKDMRTQHYKILKTNETGGKKRIWIAYLLWLFFGWWGFHLIYLRRDRLAFLWFISLGGYFGIGWFRDLWWIPRYTREANDDPDFIKEFNEKVEKNPDKPPYSYLRFFYEMIVGNCFSWLFTAAIPQEEIYGYDFSWLVHTVAPLGIALGVHTVGNVGHQKGGLIVPLIVAYLSYVIALMVDVTSPWVMAFFSAAAFERRAKQWRIKSKRARKLTRFLCFSGAVLLYLALLGSYFYFNAEMTDNNGERVKVRDAVVNFLESPLWKQLELEFEQLYNYVKAHGFYKVWEELISRMDLQGESNAMNVLDLSSTATQEEITAAYRKLSKQWHPDRHKDPTDKLAAQEKFMQIQQAYERISDLKSRRQQRNRSEL